jgi:hypothetical protein
MIIQDIGKAKEELTPADLENIKISIILALGNPDVKDMPNIEEALEKLHKKVNRLYREAVNK